MSGGVRVWRRGPDGLQFDYLVRRHDGVEYIARPVAEDAARERAVEAARRFAREDRRKPRRGDEAADALGQLFLAVDAMNAPAQGGEGPRG